MPTTVELFAQVYAHPDSFEHKEVLADRLLEEGDPRGEFIALQLKHEKGSLPPSGVKRERRLLEEHEVAWLGPLARVLIGHTTRWRHGFLDAGGARLDGSTVGSPEWSTVRRLELFSTERERPGELAADLKSLTELERANTLALDVLVKASEKPPLTSLSYLGPARSGRDWVPRQTDALLKLAELPRLTKLRLAPPTATELNGKDFAFFFESALARRLQQLSFSLVRPIARGRPIPPLALASFVRGAEPLPLQTLGVESVGLVAYELHRGAEGFSRLVVRPLTHPASTGNLLPSMMAAVRGLDAKAIERFEIIYPGRRLARRHLFAVEEAARHFPKVAAVEYRPAT